MLPGVGTVPANGGWTSPVTVQNLVEWLSAGNVVAAFIRLINGLDSGTTIDKLLPALLRNYAIFHGLVAVLFTTLAVWRLRPLELKQTYGKKAQLPFVTRFVGRPRVGSSPMLW